MRYFIERFREVDKDDIYLTFLVQGGGKVMNCLKQLSRCGKSSSEAMLAARQYVICIEKFKNAFINNVFKEFADRTS